MIKKKAYGPSNFWDNIHDVRSPSDMAKPGDTVVQPINDNKYLRYNYNAPQIYDYDGEGDKVPSESMKFQYQDKDPETEAQFPDMSLNSEKPNTPPRKAWLSDVTPDTDSSDLKTENGEILSGNHLVDSIQQLPDPYIEKIARAIVAEYNLEHTPSFLDIMENHKVAWTIPELINATSAFSVKREPNCAASFKAVRNKIFRYDFHVVCGESWSDPAGHIVKIKFLPDKRVNKGISSSIKISCSCEFWRYYGCDWKSMQKDYNERQMSNGAAPTLKNRKRNWVCKHVAACVPLIKRIYLKKRAR